MKEIIVNVKAKIEVGEDFDLCKLALCQYVDNAGEVFVPQTDEFKVIEYLETLEVNIE